ncbi:MAG: hypothetical protein JRI75_12815 [Deltaproteobacteria bacterium]|nr:hypothetical protein [Deltaproteobacteria bacterium]
MKQKSSIQKLSITCAPDIIRRFTQLLGHGFRVSVTIGGSIREILCGQLGFKNGYLDDRIQTLFLNGKAVDDVDTAVVEDASTLSLSAAMPGVAGATMRKGGRYAAMRSQISYRSDTASADRQDGEITLKLFNLVARELGPTFFERGVFFSGKVIEDFLRLQPDRFLEGLSVKADGRNVEGKALQTLTGETENIFLQVLSE